MNRPGQRHRQKICPVCGRKVNVRDNGKFTMHRKKPSERATCPGSEKRA